VTVHAAGDRVHEMLSPRERGGSFHFGVLW
jgi:hypothetical protein